MFLASSWKLNLSKNEKEQNPVYSEVITSLLIYKQYLAAYCYVTKHF